jgi:short-subunit dehydrogenase
MVDLVGRTALLTGATGGIGPHIARALAKENMNLVLAALSESTLDQLAAEMKVAGVRAIAFATDVSNQTSLEALVRNTRQEFGFVDVLVNNAAIEMFLAYDNLRPEDIERIIRVNLIGPMMLARMLLPSMLQRQRGHIVNMSALAAKAGPPHCEPYAASKAGLIAFTESLRSEYRGTGVSASVICPGFVEAGIYTRVKKELKLAAPRLLGTSSPQLVAKAVVHAIKRDVPEVIVNPGPTRLLTTLAEISPRFAEFVMRNFGIADWFIRVARTRAEKDTVSDTPDRK